MQWTTPGKCTYKKFKENNLAKVNFLKLPPGMFSLAYNLPKTTSKFGSSKFRRKKYLQAKWIFRPSKLRRKK